MLNQHSVLNGQISFLDPLAPWQTFYGTQLLQQSL